MLDLLYLLGTIGFFGLMVALTRACEHLGRRSAAEAVNDER